MSVFLSGLEKALNKCERVIDIRHCYDYLIHDTDKCRKLGNINTTRASALLATASTLATTSKSAPPKQHMLKELTWFIMSEGYETINEFTQPALERFGEQYWKSWSYSAFLVKYMNGNKMMREGRNAEALGMGRSDARALPQRSRFTFGRVVGGSMEQAVTTGAE